jgi:DNA-binding Xre family transcriptional regulator
MSPGNRADARNADRQTAGENAGRLQFYVYRFLERQSPHGVKHMINGSILKTLLSQRGMTIKDLAQKTGISIHTLYSITKRNSDNIRRVNLVKIFKALGVSELEFYSIAMKEE